MVLGSLLMWDSLEVGFFCKSLLSFKDYSLDLTEGYQQSPTSTKPRDTTRVPSYQLGGKLFFYSHLSFKDSSLDLTERYQTISNKSQAT